MDISLPVGMGGPYSHLQVECRTDTTIKRGGPLGAKASSLVIPPIGSCRSVSAFEPAGNWSGDTVKGR